MSRQDVLAAHRPGGNPSEREPMLVTRLGADDPGKSPKGDDPGKSPKGDGAEAVRAIAAASAAAVDVDAELERAWALFWVARTDPAVAPIAFLLAWAVADELHLIHIATHPEARRKGAARALMAALLAHATAVRSRLVLLEVRRSNRPAIRLYRAFAFTAMGVRRAYYADGEDAIEMRLTLDPTTGNITPGQDEVALAEA